MALYQIFNGIKSSIIPENLVLLTRSKQFWKKSAHIRPTKEEEVEEDSIWTRDLEEINIALFEENVGPTEILPEGANCLNLLLILFPEELINLIVVETNRNAEQKQAAANKVDKDWQPPNNKDIHPCEVSSVVLLSHIFPV